MKPFVVVNFNRLYIKKKVLFLNPKNSSIEPDNHLVHFDESQAS